MEILEDKLYLGRLEKAVIMILLALIGAELTAMFNINLAGFLKTIITAILIRVWDMWNWAYGYVGIVILPLLALVLLYAWCTIALVQIFRGKYPEADRERYYKGLDVVETISPLFGFLGTTLSLLSVMEGINPQLNQNQMLKALLNNSASAFGSTVFGLVNAAVAYLTRSGFGIVFLSLNKNGEKERREG